MTVLGVGHDVVDVEAFANQLAEPGTRMRELFSVREQRQCHVRATAKHDGEAAHFAARWAGKEAVLKAWCEALGELPYPYTADDFPWNKVEILDDSRSRPRVTLSGDVEARLHESLGLADMAGTIRPIAASGVAVPGNAAGLSDTVAKPDMVRNPDAAGSADTAALNGDAAAFAGTGRVAAPNIFWHVSLSHDGSVASAVVVLEGRC